MSSGNNQKKSQDPDQDSSSFVRKSNDRAIRVFISSTFKDMKEERDELVKFVFPALKKLCSERQVAWSEVDLRWGITDEQKAEGRVLPICLKEIKKCRPYFIGILGERYGWVSDDLETSLLDQEPWIKNNLGCSVTELEILHGVLNNPEMTNHAFFYFRSKEYTQSIAPNLRGDYLEIALKEEIECYGSAEAESRAAQRRHKLEKLKEKIRKSTFPVKENFQSPKAFGEMVLNDFTELINRLYPEESIPDKFERETINHENFALGRCHCYIGGEEYMERLDKHFESNEPPLVITGESGTGKSSLLANWAIRFRESHPDIKVVMHFIGTSNYSSDFLEMLKRVLYELYAHFNIQDSIPNQKEEIISAFKDCLSRIESRAKCVILFDALNKLEDKENALNLHWLPVKIPANVRIIISTLPGKSLDLLKEKEWSCLEVKPFTNDQKRQFIRSYLDLYSLLND